MSANLRSTSNALKDASPATNKETEPTRNPQTEGPTDPVADQGGQSQPAAKQPTAPKPKPPKKQTKTSGTAKDPAPDNPDAPAEETLTIDREKGLQMVLGTKHTQAAKKAGDHDKAELYHGYYASMVTNPKAPAPTDDTPHNAPTINTLTFKRKERNLTTIGGAQVNTVAGGVNFNWGDQNSHKDVGFTPYFEKNITELKGPLPLTIFNKAWQDAALSYHAKKRPKLDDNSTEKGMRYTGYPYPSKWTMSFSNWTLNYAEFHTTMRYTYRFETLGQWILLHKENADQILRKDGFMVALQYNIRVRSNAFAHRVVKNGNTDPRCTTPRTEKQNDSTNSSSETPTPTQSEALELVGTLTPAVDQATETSNPPPRKKRQPRQPQPTQSLPPPTQQTPTTLTTTTQDPRPDKEDQGCQAIKGRTSTRILSTIERTKTTPNSKTAVETARRKPFLILFLSLNGKYPYVLLPNCFPLFSISNPTQHL
ncbi:hypothetical protein PTTG_05490 [Puccinia triticina 1-1 BBBD Race 1]|uniref:Uncharacterized protein n=1 Tax=Puccinia triticina (isolate 1-1 / race 1 (BBBD)) TaxID=630390 RepID=A0A180GGJ8_PUCT1|nr:hypothetical protein PTTG_05490 [Puccinia triticina 1-1 BBBD Race 1]